MLDYTMPSCSDTVTDPNACKNLETCLWLLLELLAELLMRPNWTKASVQFALWRASFTSYDSSVKSKWFKVLRKQSHCYPLLRII